MPYTIRYDPPERFAVVELSGIITWADTRAILEALFNGPTWVIGSSILWDTRELSSIVLEPEELESIRTMMESLSKQRVGGRSAVVTRDEELEMVAKLFSGLAPDSTREMGVFESVKDALAFLERATLSDGAVTLADQR